MKGIILAGGKGTRLYPLTKSLNKHLLPVYDKPMIYYPLSILLHAEIRDICIITTPEFIEHFRLLLGNGSHLGINLTYKVQTESKGIGEAFVVAEDFINNDQCCLILGDNIFHGTSLAEKLLNAKNIDNGAKIFVCQVDNPKAYGVAEVTDDNRVLSIEEKPTKPKSNYAVTGLYFYDSRVVDYSKSLVPSARGEYEITDINKLYMQEGLLSVERLGRGFTWLDMGNHSDLLKAANYVEVIESRQGLKIACPEEIAWRKGFISSDELLSLANKNENSYNYYLRSIVEN